MLRAAVSAVVLLVLPGSLNAGPVSLLSKADPDRPSQTAGGASKAAAFSADGRYAVVETDAANLLEGVTDDNLGRDLFLHDRLAGTTVLVSHAAGDPATTGDGDSDAPEISADGRYVVFRSSATNLVAGQSGSHPGIFLYDRLGGTVSLVSHVAGSATVGASCQEEPSISADGGWIAYSCHATDLVAGQIDTPGNSDVFLYERATGINTLVSHASGSAVTAAGSSSSPSISADGEWVAYESGSTGLLVGEHVDTNDWFDVFLYNRSSGTNVLVSHVAASASQAGDLGSLRPEISADGSRVAYVSLATDIVAGQSDGNDATDLFLYDRATGTNVLVSRTHSSATATANRFSEAPSVSADGRYVAFYSRGTDLVSGVTDPVWWDVFIYDRMTGTNTLISRSAGSANVTANGDSFRPQISANGAYVLFSSSASNLVTGQTDGSKTIDLFLWERSTDTTSLVSHADGAPTVAANGEISSDQVAFRISADGSWIAFTSPGATLVAGLDDANATADVFLYDRVTGGHEILTLRGGAIPETASGTIYDQTATALSNDGRWAVFTSTAPNLIPGLTDDNNGSDIFLYDRLAATSRLISHASGSLLTAGDGASTGPLMSPDGSAILYVSDAQNLVPGQVSSEPSQLFLHDLATGGTTLVSHAASSLTTGSNGGSSPGNYAVSGDGRWIAFESGARNLVSGQVDSGWSDIFLFDRNTSQNVLVSHASSSPTQAGNSFSIQPSISFDGRYVAFLSNASNLIPGQAGAGRIFLYDRMTGMNTRISPTGDEVRISPDGRWVAFTSTFTEVVPGQTDTNSGSDLFLWDRLSGATTLVSGASGSPTVTGDGRSTLNANWPGSPAFSPDGRWLVFMSAATNLSDTQAGTLFDDVFLYDRVAGTVTLVSRSAADANVPADDHSFGAVLSASGSHVAFRSYASDLVSGMTDSNAGEDLFLFERSSGTTSLVTHIPGSATTTGNRPLEFRHFPRVSADGAWIAFASPASDLVPGDLNGLPDAFLAANPLPGRDFHTISPCRILDTREQGPALTSGGERTVAVPGLCGIPATARSLAVNVTAVQPSAAGRVTLHPGDLAAPLASTVNFASGETRTNNAILALAFDGTGSLSITPFVVGGGTVHLVVDVSGWFE